MWPTKAAILWTLSFSVTPLGIHVDNNSIYQLYRHMLVRLKADFQLSILCILASLVLVVVAPFMVYRFVRGEYVIFALDLSMISLTLAVAAYGWFSGNAARATLILATCTTAGLVLTAFYNSIVAPYWLYCMVLFNFALVPPRTALILVTIGFGVIVTQPDAFTDNTLKASFIVTLLATVLFAYIFSKRSEYQRDELMIVARTDALTNAGNRRAFDEEFAIAIANYARSPTPIAVALLDLDHFKRVNDLYGHEIGDNVLVRLVNTVNNNLRPKDRLFRIGGEEFCLLLEDAHNPKIMDTLKRLCHTIGKASLLDNGGAVTASIGATHLTPSDTVESCLKRADQALYQAKNNGRNQVVYAEPKHPI